MVSLYDGGVYLVNGKEIVPEAEAAKVKALTGREADRENDRKGTMAYSIMEQHNTSGNMENLKIKFDSMTSHDITFVGIVQTAKASGMEKFPIPYVLTNCHNSLCAVGGTINEDDHMFGLSAAKKYGGIYVPPHIAVIHQYMREMMAGCGRMILGSDSHTRYGALGTMAIGEGGGELVKQLLCDTYDVARPGVVAIYLDGKPAPYVGPQDIALAIIGAVFKNGYVKNKVMEFVGPGISHMTTDYRNGVDVMTTETTCLSSIWRTDEDTRSYLAAHGREDAYKELNPADIAYYDGCVYVDLSTVKPMIALPFHPSNAYEIDELNANLKDILHGVEEEAKKIAGGRSTFTLMDKITEDGKLMVQQGIIAGCAGGNYTNVIEAANALKGQDCGCDQFSLAVYPSSQPVFADLVKKGAISDLMAAGAIIRTAFCGPCFGAGDTPCHNGLSIRHTTRNFPNREGSKPGNGQMSAVALMDARSIAATAAKGGVLTSAAELDCWGNIPEYEFDDTSYKNRVYFGYDKAETEKELIYGPNIKDWPEMSPLTDNILLKVCSKIMDPVTTTDELIPSGETSSFRSNPLGLAEFTLSRRDPEYVGRTKVVDQLEKARVNEGEEAETGLAPELKGVFETIRTIPGNENVKAGETEIGSMIYAVKPGDGSAREQAASCQRVIGGLANICKEYATKRYRSNVMNWGMIPFQMEAEPEFEVGDYIYVPGIRKVLEGDMKHIKAYVIGDTVKELDLYVADMTAEEREIVKAGCLINYNRNR
ncbi:hydratase [Enterocloster asparagiformis]|uniref:Aconitase family protein n=2 Tax=Enterocloster asparagiformis TaxID=333367 RepID=C0D901_9FIRM|nr:hydratase [Enterocloster asparagiformis]EEG52196.1 aconitase family protein [[Clostridium] asparagiforme DSM 15981]RGX31411.1 hydratase [Enterocloster asparagiformis]UWO74556.1 hydratase [[Clostridium] asparagiforme DSM 15981]